jgi:hypothetical protein
LAENERFKSLSGERFKSLSGTRVVFAVSINMSLFREITYGRPTEKTKSAKDKPNALGDVEIISEELIQRFR